ncbi:unnamed protein product [Rhodiola kirilowii]
MWHRRLGHVNFRLLKRLHNQNLVIGLPKVSEVPDQVCSACAKGKQEQVHDSQVSDDVVVLTRPKEDTIAADSQTLETVNQVSGQVAEVEEPGEQAEVNGQVPEVGEVHGEPEEIQETQEVTELRRSTRVNQSSVALCDYVCYAAVQEETVMNAFVSLIEPKTVEEALKDPDWIQAMQDELHQFLTISPLVEELTFFLGLQVRQLDNGTEISQHKYLSEVVSKYGFGGSRHMNTPSSPNESFTKDDASPKMDATRYRGMIGSLLYLTISRPDIMFSVCQCARFQAKPRESHVKAVKRILRYLKGTEKLVLWYPRVKSLRLEGFTDADFAGDKTDRKSTSGLAQFLGSCLVSWSSKKQVEYVAAAACCAQILWLQNQLSDFNLHFDQVPIFCDNTSAISIAKNLVLHGKTKHIEIKHHFIRDYVEKELVTINFCRSEDQVADIFTKALHREAFEKLRMELGLMSPQ